MTLMTILREISRLTTKGKISEEDSRGASSALWGTKRGKRWGSWVGRGAQRWNGGAETIGRRVYKRAARPPRPQLRSHPASMTVTQVARKYLGKKFNFLKFCDKLLSFDWREVFPNQQPGKLWFDWNFETLKLWSLENRSQKGAKVTKMCIQGQSHYFDRIFL